MKSHTNLDKIDRVPLRERVYYLIQQAIVSGELQPGQRVRDVDLATQLGVSRTPVREALQRLADEGLVEMLPGALTRIVPLGKQAAQDAFVVVAAVHALATRLAVSRLTESDIDTLRRANNNLIVALTAYDVDAALQADDTFHEVFVQQSTNREIRLTLDRLMPKVRRLEYAQFGSFAGHTSVQQHRAIIAACEQGQAEQAAALTEQNWLNLGQLIVKAFGEDNAQEQRKDV
jgi:DNA-binding GntR family transcriptional regulator